jgi:isopenicillin N synthase-like dioxygenase
VVSRLGQADLDSSNRRRVQPHSDAGVLTILLVDKDVRGLQVQRDGVWYNVPPMPYTLLINLGDVMEVIKHLQIF